MNDSPRAAADYIANHTLEDLPLASDERARVALYEGAAITLADWAVQELAARAEREAEAQLPVNEAWLRSIGFKDKRYQGGEYLSFPLPCPIGDSQWIQIYIDSEDGMGLGLGYLVFELCRWSDSYSVTMPPDRFHVAPNRGQLLALLEALKGGA